MKDWDSNRLKIVNHTGEEFVLFKPEANRLYNASLSVYKKYKKRSKK